MATKTTTRKRTTTSAKSARHTTNRPASAKTVKIRMYRQGLGDCFLVTLPRADARPFYLMIDCGVIIGTQDATNKMRNVVTDIVKTTKGHIDLLIATHEHWDHLSGFVQAKDVFDQLNIDQVWMGWTENPENELAKTVRTERQQLRDKLAFANNTLKLQGSGDNLIDGMLDFFGAAGRGTTEDALEFVRELGQKNGGPRYCYPEDAPVEFEGTGVRAYVLGPPHSEQALKRSNPSKAHPETYGLSATFLDQLAPAIDNGDQGAPFDPVRRIPLDIAKQQMPFFRTHYWGYDTDSPSEQGQAWRRIDADWLGMASDLALKLDNDTNNTSLVLALELPNSEVLLFAADAQVGSWLSWQDLVWPVGSKAVTGPDLLSRTVFYKVGHHGSHNATLREKGLELMTKLRIACVPVDHEMAFKKHWGKMPLKELEVRLNEMTQGCVLRIDQPIPDTLKNCVQADAKQELYYEVELEIDHLPARTEPPSSSHAIGSKKGASRIRKRS